MFRVWGSGSKVQGVEYPGSTFGAERCLLVDALRVHHFRR